LKCSRYISIEREVRKASRELNHQTSKLDDMQKIEALQRRCADLFAEMKRLERENIKNKKRGDQLQKDKDHSRTELSKNITLKEKLEKLCRELQRENNRLKVGASYSMGRLMDGLILIGIRAKIKLYKMRKSRTMKAGTQNSRICCGNYRTIKTKRIIRRHKLSMLKLMNCTT
jgi:predicted RNase H-like nuclease (RuvC/YqgF family)